MNQSHIWSLPSQWHRTSPDRYNSSSKGSDMSAVTTFRKVHEFHQFLSYQHLNFTIDAKYHELKIKFSLVSTSLRWTKRSSCLQLTVTRNGNGSKNSSRQSKDKLIKFSQIAIPYSSKLSWFLEFYSKINISFHEVVNILWGYSSLPCVTKHSWKIFMIPRRVTKIT